MSAAWGSHGESTVARHEWKGLAKLGGRLEDWMEKEQLEGAERALRDAAGRPRRSTRLRGAVPGGWERDDTDEEDGDYVPY